MFPTIQQQRVAAEGYLPVGEPDRLRGVPHVLTVTAACLSPQCVRLCVYAVVSVVCVFPAMQQQRVAAEGYLLVGEPDRLRGVPHVHRKPRHARPAALHVPAYRRDDALHRLRESPVIHPPTTFSSAHLSLVVLKLLPVLGCKYLVEISVMNTLLILPACLVCLYVVV